MKKLRLFIFTPLLAILGLVLLAPLTASAAATTQRPAAPHSITGTATGSASNGDTFSGTFTATRFVTRNGHLVATGTLSGTIKNASGNVVRNFSNLPEALSINIPAALPVTSATATCSILNLVLGPLDLNLLGLTVHLNQVVLIVNAIAGAGSLLGNLLCSVAGLLNAGGPLTGIVGLLNQILAAL